MKEEIITEYNNLYRELSKLKEILTYDFFSIDRIQIAYFDSYVAKKECVNVEKFEFIFNALIDGKISHSLIFDLVGLMFETITLLNSKVENINKYYSSALYEFAINDAMQHDDNLKTIRELENLVEEFNHIHEKTALKIFKEKQKDYNVYRINYYDYYKVLLKNYLEKFQKYSDKKNIPKDELKKGKYFDMEIVSKVHKVCNGIQFENLTEVELYLILNLQPTNARLKIKKDEIIRMCYLIYNFSFYFKEDEKSEWIDTVLNSFSIKKGTYNSKCTNPNSETTGDNNAKFRKLLKPIFPNISDIS